MDIKVYEEKVRELQSKLPFVERVIERLKDRPNNPGRLEKFQNLHRLIESTKRQRIPINVIMKVENVVRDLFVRCEFAQANESIQTVPVKQEANDVSDKASVCESVSETPDSPSPTRPYDRTSPIEIPTERSDDREPKKVKDQKDNHRYEDNRRYRPDHQRPMVDKYVCSKYESNRSRFDQHERSKSRDRNRNDRRERSNSSELRARHGKKDWNRYRPDDRDGRDNSKKKYDQRTDRVVKTERSDRYSPSSARDFGKPGKSLENDFHKVTIGRFGTRPTSTVVKSAADDDRFTEDEIAELAERNKRLYGCDSDDEKSTELRNLIEVRSKLATQMKLAESMRNKNKPSPPPASNEKTGSRFQLSSLRECTPTPPIHPVKENTTKFSFLKTFNQSSKTAEKVSEVHVQSKDAISIDDDLINKIVAQPTKVNDRCHNQAIPIKDVNIIKQALETAKNQQRLALKYNPKVKPRLDQNVPETTIQSHYQPEVSQPNNLQLVCFNDQRMSRARDPRVQAQQDPRFQAFSPPSTPPCIPNYPPIIQSSSGYKQNAYPKSGLPSSTNPFAAQPGQHNAYPSTASPQHHPQTHSNHSNLISITPHVSTYNNHRGNHSQMSPVSSSDVSPTCYQYPSFPEHNRNSSGVQGIHNKFRPSLNDNVERQKYEQSRARRSSVYYDQPPRETPMTYGEYKRSLQSTVSSTSEKVNHESRAANVSASHHDKVYRSGNYSTVAIPSVETKSTGSKFKIPKKTTNETTTKVTHTTEPYDSKDSEDEQSSARGVKDSDDSEHETSGNDKKTIVNSDSESSDVRDPRIRVQALKNASQSIDNITKDPAEKQNNVVTSSTSIMPEKAATADMDFLKYLTNTNNLLELINKVGQISDDQTITKVKEILEKAKETSASTSTPNEENAEHLSTSMDRSLEKIDVPKTPRKKSKNELEKLNEDIRTMFISDGVLNATGRRVCALYNNNAADGKESGGGKNAKAKKQVAKDDDAVVKKSTPVEGRITRRRYTMVEPSARAVKPPVERLLQLATPDVPKATAATPDAKKTPESKITTEKPKAATKVAKTKKLVEPVEDSDETPTKRVTRAQMKECNIVLEKLSPDASVESLTNADSPRKELKGKRRNEALLKQPAGKKAKTDTMKNINPEFHSLYKLTQCQVCDKSAKLSIVNHYVNYHPNSEVVTCRLAPEVADALRNMKVAEIAKRVQRPGSTFSGYSHTCYFCNVSKTLGRTSWTNHLAKHTGYYQYRCNDCSRTFSEKTKSHACKDRNNLAKIPQPQFKNSVLPAVICDLCNFVRFNKKEMEKHLRCEHETTVTNQFKEVTFLKFPNRQKKNQIELDDEEHEDVSDNDEEEEVIAPSTAKRRKLISDTDSIDKDVSENSTEKVLRSRVVHTEAFISEPKEDDGLFDKDTMKLMKDNTFSASKDGECSSPSIRAKSIAEKLSERFNSVQDDSPRMSEAGKSAKSEPLDPLNCDEGITIIRVTASDDSHVEASDVEMTTGEKTVKVIEQTSPSSVTAPSRENNCTPTEEFNDESDDNWESYSSDDSDDDSDMVAESTVMQRQPNRKNVGIIDTIARLQQSISSQGTSNNVDGVEKLSETASLDDNASVKDEGNNESISVAVQQQVDPDSSVTQSEEQVVDGKKVTYEAIVSEAMQVDVDGVKKCVSTGRSPNGNHSFNFKGSDKTASRNVQRGNLGDSSSNADSTMNDVDMMDVNNAAKILTRIDNIGYTRSTSPLDSSVSFCCLIDDCGFESPDLSDLLGHIDDHQTVEWFGYCYTCDAQVKNERLQMMMEFMHMTTAHYNKKDDEEMSDKANTAGKSSFIKCKMLPGDKLSKLKEEEIAAKAEQLSINAKPSTSSFIKVEAKFLKISNAKSLTPNSKALSSDASKSSDTPMVITNVMSLGSTIKEYNDSEQISLKEWLQHPTKKLQKHCKKMLRDICLYALFKCMDINCTFTTDNADNMLIHLRNHESVSCEPNWLECAYCDIVADSCALLVKHIQDEHQSSIFQCPYCFYRSCAAFNVVVHLKLFHQSEKKSVLVCNGKPRLYATEKALIEKSRRENIRPLRCTEGCNKITYVMDHFVKHMQSSPAHNDKFKCQSCGFDILISQTAKHLLVHSVGVYECVYCHYGANDVENIQNHMCNTHPSKLLYICVRLTRKDRVLSEEQLSSVESTLIFHLGQTVDNKLFQRCPFTDDQLSVMDPAIASKSKLIEMLQVPSNPQPVISGASGPSISINIASVTSISNESFANTTETSVATSNTGLMLSDVLSYKDLEKDYMSDDWDKYFTTLSPAAKTKATQPIMPKRKSSVTQAKVELPESKKTSTAPRPDLLQDEIDNAAYILVKGTGLEGQDLYRCSMCEEQSDDIFCFNVHLVKHTQSQVGFKCYHCNVTSKNIVGLKYHIKVHGIHRYFCYYCNYTSSIVNDIQKHMMDTHSKTLVNNIPLNPKKQDQNKDMFVVCPRGLRQEELNRFGIALIDRNKRQNTSNKRFYSPDDIELLPRQAIFNSSLSCDVCDYSTKVRTNMYRHLAGHKNEKNVPKIDPVNPVPCLDSGEKHFDKMINLACSSNDGKTTPYDSSTFIPEARRFVCNARNCQYQNISENMLQRHLTTLHPNEEQYKCPHCNSLICPKMDADKVIYHLRMHDSKIYKCPKCMFAHHVKLTVEKHRDELHPGVPDPPMLITRDETTTASNVPDGQPKVSKWKCNLCYDSYATQKLVQTHMQTVHSIKFQYQCDICSEVQSNNKTIIQDHITLKHRNQGSRIKVYYTKVECAENDDNTPIWRRDDPNKIKHIRGILFEEENVRKSTTSKKDQSEVKKKTSQKKRSDKPVVEQNSDIGDVPAVVNESETKSNEDSESNAIVIISDEDTDADKPPHNEIGNKPTTSHPPPTPSTSKNLLESGKSFIGSSKTPIKLSETVVRAEATSSGIKSKKESLDKAYLCGKCGQFSDNSIPRIREHQSTAHPNVECEVFMLNTNNEAQQSRSTTKHLPDATIVSSKPKLADGIIYACHHCIFKSTNVATIYKHWKENHKFPKVTTKNIQFPSQPFMFGILKTFQCCYCRRSSHHKDLRNHMQRYHSNETFAMIDKLNPKKCVLCPHQFNDTMTDSVIEHFKESHKNVPAEVELDMFLTDEWIDELASALPREQVKCTQPNCNIIFFSRAELDGHTNEKHAGSGVQFVSVANDPIMYGCVHCKELNADESAMVVHIRGHFHQFQCKFCEKRYNSVDLIKVHHEIMHKTTDETYRNIDTNEYSDKFSSMKIIFPNGLTLKKADAKLTRYGAMDGIMKLVNDMNVQELEVVRKRQEEKIETVTVSRPATIKKKNLKRLRISSDSDSGDVQPAVIVPRKLTLRKKRKPNPVATKLAESKLKSESTSDDNVPLQALVAPSSVRSKSKVDLSKVFIDMPIGTGIMRVSCDRFALLCNINPKIRLRRCDGKANGKSVK